MQANWESAYPPKPVRYGIPAIYLNLEVGLSFSSEAKKTHTAGMKYASRRMEEKLHDQRIREQYEEGRYRRQHPSFLMPANGAFPAPSADPLAETQTQAHIQAQSLQQQQQQRQRRLGVNTREQHVRGTSAPPTTLDRSQPLSPVSPISMVSPESPARTIPPERSNQPLPPTPSQFRLGEADMPWSMDPVFVPFEPSEPLTPRPKRAALVRDEELPQLDETKPEGDLEALHLAMMTVDSLDSDSWEPPTWVRPLTNWRASTSIGWAVSSDDAEISGSSLPPPSYLASRREPPRDRSRPRTART